MNLHRVQGIIVTVLAVALMLVAVNQEPVSAQGPEIVSISSPAEGETVSGIITFSGVIDFHDFLKYEVFLRGGGNLIWVATGYSPVINGNLAQLDTKIVMDGSYQIVVRPVRSDSNYTEFLGPTITIENGLGAPLPFPEVHSSLLYPPPGGYSVARISNCSGLDMEFDYVGDTGGCSHDDLWIKAKLEQMPLCTIHDILLKPCLYRGTVVGMGEERGGTYQTLIEPGKVYEFEYPGGGRIFIREVPGDERAENDTGAAAAADMLRFEKAAEAGLAVPVIPTVPAKEGDTAAAAEGAAPAMAEDPAPAMAGDKTAAAADDSGTEATASEDAEEVLPESGQAAAATSTSFVVTALGVIVLMIIGGLAAAYRGKQTA